MVPAAISQTVFVNYEGNGSIVCPECQTQKTAKLTAYLHHHTPLNVDCPSCRHHFFILLNTRRYYRKSVQLQGLYMPPGTSAQKRMQVIDLSLTGIGFKTILPHVLRVEDIVAVRFSLDDSRRTEVNKHIRIQWVYGLHVGAAFCDRQALERDIGFYLRPA